MANEELPPPGGPVGRVQMEPEPEPWGQAAAHESGGGSNMQKVAWGAAALVVMVGLLVFMLWAALQPTPG